MVPAPTPLGLKKLKLKPNLELEAEVQATHQLLTPRASGVPLPHPGVAVQAEPTGLWASHTPAQPVQGGPKARARWGRGSHFEPLAGADNVRPLTTTFPAGPSSYLKHSADSW